LLRFSCLNLTLHHVYSYQYQNNSTLDRARERKPIQGKTKRNLERCHTYPC